jgi:hypothetical protein
MFFQHVNDLSKLAYNVLELGEGGDFYHKYVLKALI